MDATLLLANSAETNPNGTVSALGIGWSVTHSPTPPSAIVMLIKVPWDRTNVPHKLVLSLLSEDGHPVLSNATVTGSPGPVRVEADFEVGRPPGVPRGIAIDQAVALNISPGLQLQPGGTYDWKLEIDGEVVASRSFLCGPIQPGGRPRG